MTLKTLINPKYVDRLTIRTQYSINTKFRQQRQKMLSSRFELVSVLPHTGNCWAIAKRRLTFTGRHLELPCRTQASVLPHTGNCWAVTKRRLTFTGRHLELPCRTQVSVLPHTGNCWAIAKRRLTFTGRHPELPCRTQPQSCHTRLHQSGPFVPLRMPI